jgi:hypothetical protein
MAKKQRVEITPVVAANVLFLSDRICCVCRIPRRPIQIHHIDDDPSNSAEENLAILCLECHRDTQIRGGFDRKLDCHQLRLYRADWHEAVRRRRHGPEDALDRQIAAQNWSGLPITDVRLQGKHVRLGYVQISEKDDEHRYFLSAEYPEIVPNESSGAFEVNLSIASGVIRILQRFRADAISQGSEKRQYVREKTDDPPAHMVWDDISVSFDVVIFSSDLLVLEFNFMTYHALAAHPDHRTKTMNFLLRPSPTPVEIQDLFVAHSGYLEFISKYCVDDLHAHQSETLKQSRGTNQDSWIVQGASPRPENFEKFLITPQGLKVFFDSYEVACYAEGRKEVFIPRAILEKYLKEPFLALMK